MPTFFSNGATIIIAVLLVLAIAYRYYSAFIAAKVLSLDPRRQTPAHAFNDGHNFCPTNKWVLFGHHFAAISGAGPLIGPVLAAQFGYLPGLLWILIGVCLAGAVQDFIVLVISTRRNGKSIAQIAFTDIGPAAGTAATIGILFVLVIAIAGLGKVVTKALGGETQSYPAKTEFIGARIVAGHEQIFPISVRRTYGRTTVYRIPKGAQIKYAGGEPQVLDNALEIEVTSLHSPVPPDVDDSYKFVQQRNTQPRRVPTPGPRRTGEHLTLPDDVRAISTYNGSVWGTFTIALTIPIALFIGVYMFRLRKNHVLEASILGGILTLAAVYVGGLLTSQDYPMLNAYGQMFNLSERQVGLAMAVYGFAASILPVWMLLCPRDYLSSFLKIGTVGLLVVGVIVAHPHLQAPAINSAFISGGPVVQGAVFPFLFITIMCGAVSGFHALVASGTTPKMIDKETDARMIGYGAMLMEGLVGILALIAATALPTNQYYDINTQPEKLPLYQQKIQEVAAHDPASKLDQPLPDVGEHLQGRVGGAVTLAIGMAYILNSAVTNVIGNPQHPPAWLGSLFTYWYHFAIMFEALFILTTIDAGTRIGRFLLQETLGKWVHPKLGKTDSWPSAIAATLIITLAWWYFLDAHAFAAIWVMFGIANQALAIMALAIVSAALVRVGRARYLPVTLLPLLFVIVTTGSAAILKLIEYVGKIGHSPESPADPYISLFCILAIMACALVVTVGSVISWGRPLSPAQPPTRPIAEVPEFEGA